MSVYLDKLRAKYDGLRTSIEGLQTRAADENRDLTEDELRSVTEQADEAKKLAAQITDLTEIEVRNRKVAEMAGQVAEDVNTETRTATTTAKDRDPGHYRSLAQGGTRSFFSDLVRKQEGDDEANRRLTEHTRALTSAAHGPGVVAPIWLTQEFEELARQGRRLAAAVRHIPISSAAALTLPKQTVGTDAVIAAQAAENDAAPFTDAYDTDVATVTPVTLTGGQTFSRQLLDSATPAIDQLLYADMLAVYNQQVETRVFAAMVAAAGTAVNTYATEAAWTTAVTTVGTMSDDVIELAIAVRNARKLPADILALSVTRYGDLLKLKDSAGRPLIPMESSGPMNVIGTGSVAVDGRIHGLGIIATDGVTQYPESIVAARANDTILFESPVLQFRYDQPLGPSSVKLGVYGYVATHVTYPGKSTKRNVITAA